MKTLKWACFASPRCVRNEVRYCIVYLLTAPRRKIHTCTNIFPQIEHENIETNNFKSIEQLSYGEASN